MQSNRKSTEVILPNGNIMECYVDDNLYYQGDFIIRNEVDNIVVKGRFVDSKYDGKVCHYYLNKILVSETEYKLGKKHGIRYTYSDRNGKLLSKEHFLNDKAHGFAIMYLDKTAIISFSNNGVYVDLKEVHGINIYKLSNTEKMFLSVVYGDIGNCHGPLYMVI